MRGDDDRVAPRFLGHPYDLCAGRSGRHHAFHRLDAGTFEGEFSPISASYAGKGVARYEW